MNNTTRTIDLALKQVERQPSERKFAVKTDKDVFRYLSDTPEEALTCFMKSRLSGEVWDNWLAKGYSVVMVRVVALQTIDMTL